MREFGVVMQSTVELGGKVNKGGAGVGCDVAVEPNYCFRKWVAFYGSW